ncbi:MAG: FkbM family methyltransferase [Ginsengibacter sp.]
MRTLKRLGAIFRYMNNHPLAGRHKIVAYSKFIRWQLIQLINPSEKKMPFAGSTSLMIKKGMAGATGNIYLGLHDFCEMGFLLHFLKPDDLFADIGANIGSYSILASGVNGAAVIAFEPYFKTYNQLQKNITINHLENNIKAYNIALGARVDTLYFTTALDTINHIIASDEMDNKEKRVEVNVDKLDNIVKNCGIPALIKIDVEGFETEVINGMEETLENEKLKAIIIELNGSGSRYSYDENNIHHKLVLHGFQPYLYDPFKRDFTLSEKYGPYNTLYLRDINFIKERISRAKKIMVFNESF